jgi:protein-tyrosine phosphatase
MMLSMAIWSGTISSVSVVTSVALVECVPVLLFSAYSNSIESDNVKVFLLGLNFAVALMLLLLDEFDLLLAMVLGYWTPILAYYLYIALIPSSDLIHAGLRLGNTAAAHRVAHLKKHRVTHVLELHDGRHGNAAVPPPGDVVLHRSLLYRPADDLGAGSMLDDAVRFIDAARKAKGTVLLACHTGVSRSPAVAAAYLIRSHGFSVKEALRIVLDGRPLADPSLLLRMRLRELHPLHDYDSKNAARPVVSPAVDDDDDDEDATAAAAAQ